MLGSRLIKNEEKACAPSRSTRGLLWPLLALLFASAGFIATRLAPGHEAWIERVYSRALYPLWAAPISSLIGLLPFSVAEAAVLTAPVWVGAIIWRAVARHRRRGASRAAAWARAALAVAGVAALLYGAFSWGWAINYSRQPYAVVADLPVEPSTPGELAALCADITCRANALREGLAEDADGVFTADKAAMRKGISAAYRTASLEAPWLGGSYGSPKPLLLSRGMSWAGISGIFIPMTFEANVNADEPLLLAGSSAAHEAAHLRGFAREDEANYIAYVVCRASEDPAMCYSGEMLALIHACNALASADPDAFAEVYALRSEAVLRDLADYNAYWRAFEGPVQEAQARVNDAYLKANHQSDGVRSYGRMVDLMLAERRRMSANP